MGVGLQCKCYNVTIYIQNEPVKCAQVFDCLKDYSLANGIGKTTLEPVAGITMEVPLATSQDTLNNKDKTLTCLICKNCDTFIYCTEDQKEVFVNLDLDERKNDSATHSHEISSQFYSDVWKILLNDEDDCSNSVLEPPEVDEKVKYEAFKRLENKIQNYMLEEEQAMKDRIREYEQKQLEEYRELQSRAYRDRKVLWHKLSKILPSEPKSIILDPIDIDSASEEISDDAESPVYTVGSALQSFGSLTTAMTTLEHQKRKAEQEEEKPTTKPVKQSGIDTPKTTWKNSRISEKKPRDSDWMFQFDEDDNESLKAESEDIQNEPQDDDLDDFNIDDYDDFRPNNYPIASSVPVSIPAAFTALGERSPPATKKDQQQQQQRRRGVRTDFDTPSVEESRVDQDMMSKSFAVPVSRNKVRGMW